MDRRGYAAVLAIALLSPARGTFIGRAIARAGGTVRAVPREGSQQQATASQSSGAAQSSDTQKGTDPPESGSAMHSITVQFDYDFTKRPACTGKVRMACVQKLDGDDS